MYIKYYYLGTSERSWSTGCEGRPGGVQLGYRFNTVTVLPHQRKLSTWIPRLVHKHKSYEPAWPFASPQRLPHYAIWNNNNTHPKALSLAWHTPRNQHWPDGWLLSSPLEANNRIDVLKPGEHPLPQARLLEGERMAADEVHKRPFQRPGSWLLASLPWRNISAPGSRLFTSSSGFPT